MNRDDLSPEEIEGNDQGASDARELRFALLLWLAFGITGVVLCVLCVLFVPVLANSTIHP